MSLLNLTPSEFCASTNACEDGRDWAITQPTMADVWDNCPRPDWLLWITDKLGQRPDDRTLRLFAVWCARSSPLTDGRYARAAARAAQAAHLRTLVPNPFRKEAQP